VVARAARFLPGAAAACWLALTGCGSRTGFLDGDGASLPDDDATGAAGGGGSAGSAGAGGLGSGGSSMLGAGGSIGETPPSVEPPPPELPEGCANGGAFEGDVVIFSPADFAQLEGCTELRGNLQILARVADLRQLRSLREVEGRLSIVRGPVSLEGLESLREVWELQLDSLVPASLQPLAGLLRVRTLSISGDMRQTDLNGLGGIINLRELQIHNSTLPSLAGLAVPSRMSAIRIEDSFTTDLTALAGVTQIDDDLVLTNVQGLTTLDVFAGLDGVQNLALTNNPDLIHIDALGQGSGLEYLFVDGNAKLERLPDLEGTRDLEIVQIVNNPALRNVPRFGLVTRVTQLTIQGNPALERVEFPGLTARSPSLERGSFLSIVENAALTQISAAGLTETGSLTIAANPVLTSAAFPLLQAVPGRLTIIDNAALVSASLGTLLTATTSARKIAANQGDSPLTSCPYTNDDHCDQTSNVCAPGSDLVDCGNGYPPY
jgi:hypothetical protein